jgi:benzodiazapine receptor
VLGECDTRDMTWRVVAVAAVIITIVVYAVGSGALVSTGSTWYLALDKPAWQPASWIFGLIWPYNFVAIGVVGSVIAWNAAPARVIAVLVLLAVTVAFALTWAYLFYGPHQLTGAAIALTATAVLTLPIVAIAFAERWWLGVLLVPYQVWVAIAASLSWGYVAKAGA